MLRNYSLRHHNTFGLDVLCSYACKVHDSHKLESLYHDRFFAGERWLVLGGGSNVLFMVYFRKVKTFADWFGCRSVARTAFSVLITGLKFNKQFSE